MLAGNLYKNPATRRQKKAVAVFRPGGKVALVSGAGPRHSRSQPWF